MWTIPSTIKIVLNLMNDQGLKNLGSIDMVKLTGSKKLRKSTGFYLQHAKDTLTIFCNSEVYDGLRKRSDLRLPNSRLTDKSCQVPQLLKSTFEKLNVRKFVEVYGRDNNVNPGWTCFGNQISEPYENLGVHIKTGLFPKEFVPERKPKLKRGNV